MQLAPFKNDNLLLIEQMFNDKRTTWSNMENFYNKSQEWLYSNFMNINVQQMDAEMHSIDTINTTMKIR